MSILEKKNQWKISEIIKHYYQSLIYEIRLNEMF